MQTCPIFPLYLQRIFVKDLLPFKAGRYLSRKSSIAHVQFFSQYNNVWGFIWLWLRQHCGDLHILQKKGNLASTNSTWPWWLDLDRSSTCSSKILYFLVHLNYLTLLTSSLLYPNLRHVLNFGEMVQLLAKTWFG